MAFRSLAFSFRIAHNTIGSIVYETCEAIWVKLQKKHMPVPTTDDFRKIANDYERLWNFPNCIGSIDGKHIRIRNPPKSGSMYYNYKKYFSIHLQGIADAKCRFIAVDVGAYGRQSDSGVFVDTAVYHHMENGSFNVPPSKPLPGTESIAPHVLLGDQGYPLKEYLMRPYPTAHNMDHEKEIFNYRLSRARRTIECAFGILVSKWRCLKTEFQLQPGHVDIVVKCVCILDNIVIDREGVNESECLSVDSNANQQINDFEKGARRFNRSSRRAYEIRETFKQYFISTASPPHNHSV